MEWNETFGKLKSEYNSELRYIYDTYPIEIENSVSYSIPKDEEVNVFGPFDYVRPVDPGLLPLDLLQGEYYVSVRFKMNDDIIWFPNSFYPLNFIKYILLCGYVIMSDIHYGIIANKHIASNLLSKYTTDKDEFKRNIKEDVRIHKERGYIPLQRHLVCQQLIENDQQNVRIYINQTIRPVYTLVRSPITYIKVDETQRYKQILQTQNALVRGMPGCGKSYELLEIVNRNPHRNTLVTALTHAATENLRARGILYTNPCTFTSAIWDPELCSSDYENLGKYDIVILEEFTMLPPSYMNMLIKAWKTFGFRVICFGDPDQCPAPTDDWIHYHTNPLFLEMCGNTIIEMQYKEGFSRYDRPLYNALLNFKNTGRLSAWQDQPPIPCLYKNIVYTNRLRSIINAECFERWVSEHKSEVVNIDKFPVCIGLPVMAYHGTDKWNNIYKTQIWIIEAIDINEETITLNKDNRVVSLRWEDFCEIFDYSFAITAHKSQGITIHEDFVIHETNIMSWEIAYTAISRGVALSKIHIADISDRKLKRAERKPSIEIKQL